MATGTETPLLIEQDLYFGTKLPGGGEISEEEFQEFVNNVITPRFAGLTAFDANGQFLRPKANSIQEDTNVITLFVEDTLESEAAIDEVIRAYKQQFRGAGVLQVTNEDDLKVGFSVGQDDLIENDLIPEQIRVDLFFGRNIAGVGEVSEEEFQAFLDNTVAPHVPGLTVFDAVGQFQDEAGAIVEELTKVVSLILEDTQQNETIINEIIGEYVQRFQQSSVLQAVNEDITISFGPTDNLIKNDPIPEPIQVDLFFGRNIAGVGEVSEEEFQTFLDNTVAPRVPRLTVFDAVGQFQDEAGMIIEEPTKVVSLVLKDTRKNEVTINDVVEEYIQLFCQESVLIVVDEDIQIDPFGCGVVGQLDTLLATNSKSKLQAEQDNLLFKKEIFETAPMTFTDAADSSYAVGRLGIRLSDILPSSSREVFDYTGLMAEVLPDTSLVTI